MNRTDHKLRNRLKQEAPVMPEDVAVRMENTLSELTAESAQPRRHSTAVLALRLSVAVLALAFFILPNVNCNIAYAMQDIPVVGQFVRVITIYKKDVEDEYHPQHIDIPSLETQNGLEEPIDYINADVKELTDAVIAQYEADIADLPDSHVGLNIDYEVLTNTDTWFTLRLLIYQEAGTGTPMYRYYHIDKQKGALVTLADLFVSRFDYVSVLSENIKQQMAEQMAEDPNKVYWYYPDDNTYSGFYEIKPDQDFYWDENGDLVIVFEKYEVAPGSMGCPAFVIPSELYQSSLS